MRACSLLFIVIEIAFHAAAADARLLHRRLHGSLDPVKIELLDFTSTEERTIERAIAILAARLAEIDPDTAWPLSRFEKCVAKYATKDFVFWDTKLPALENKYRNAYAIYSDLTRVIDYHFKKAIPVSIGAVTEPLSTWGASMLGYRPDDNDIPELYIELNRAALKKYPNAVNEWAGTVFHELLHRIGLSHPSGYTGSLIREAEGCFMRRSADRHRL
jgi:hypothetical protein